MRSVNKTLCFVVISIVFAVFIYVNKERIISIFCVTCEWLVHNDDKKSEEDASCVSGPFSYDYSRSRYELSIAASMGSEEEFEAWRAGFSKVYKKFINDIPIQAFSGVSVDQIAVENEARDYTLSKVEFKKNNINVSYGGLLAIPKNINPDLPIIIAIHGHEEKKWGVLSLDNFTEKRWMHDLAASGYVVFAPISMYHKEIADIADQYSYPLVWTKLVSNSIDQMSEKVFKQIAHKGLAVAGLSSGGMTGFCLMAYRDDIVKGIFSGSFIPLDFLRKEYRIKGHPDCWDIPFVRSYAAIQSLMAPRPVMFQEGRRDSMFPRFEPLEPTSSFSGTTRGVTVYEFSGGVALLEDVWGVASGGKTENFCLYIHDGGHEFVPGAAVSFLGGRRDMCY